jgi:hypothetical protein
MFEFFFDRVISNKGRGPGRCSSVSPREKVLMEVPRRSLDDFIKSVKEYVPLVPREFIFNLDECGFSD